MNLVFPAGSIDGDFQCIDVTIIGDKRLEGNETFNVVLSAVSTGVTIGHDVTRIVIIDDDGKLHAFHSVWI